MSRGSLVLLRHGQSTANAAKTFTGLLDVDLTPLGQQQARAAGQLLVAERLRPDEVLTSPMRRAARTTELVRDEAGLHDVPLVRSWRLAERDYGSLTDVAKSDARRRYGDEAYIAVRRTLHGSPGPAAPDQVSGWGATYTDPGSGLPAPGSGESLADVVERVTPVWHRVRAAVLAGRTVLVVAHGNSLRALSVLIDDLTPQEVQGLNLPPAQPLRYDVSHGALAPRGGHFLAGAAAHAAAERIAREGGT